jgi:hypothetical protein
MFLAGESGVVFGARIKRKQTDQTDEIRFISLFQFRSVHR